MYMNRFLKGILIAAIAVVPAVAGATGQNENVAAVKVAACDRADLPGVNFHDMARDTVRITELLKKGLREDTRTPGQMVALMCREFLGTPYVAHTLEGSTELLRVNLDELDCSTFMETAVALAMTVNERRGSWHDYLRNLERIRYRSGVMDGYASRLHYVADWVSNNVYRGNVLDAALLFPDTDYMVKTIDFMSEHRNLYPALADSATLEAIKHVENGYVNHRFPYIKASRLGRRDVMASFRDGDMVAFMTNMRGLDVSHWGIVVLDSDGVPHVMHASSSGGKVVLTDGSLADFVKRNGYPGVRVLRLR